MHLKTYYALAVAIRVLVSVLTRTFFQPDEYFQCLEPAHRIAFGYGHLTWEWASAKPIRSTAYPAIWAAIFKLLVWIGLGSDGALILAPKMLSGLLASLTDIYIYKLTQESIGRQYSNAVLYLSLTSFFHFLALSRTLATSLETVLTTISLFFWMRGYNSTRNYLRKALVIAAISCILRPTGAVMWSYMFLDMFISRRAGLWFIRDCIFIGSCAIAAAAFVDSYKLQPDSTAVSLSLSILNFLRVNSSSVSQFYGRMPWHYYLSQALPLLCTTTLPYFVFGFWKAINGRNRILQRLAYLIAWTTSIYSAIPHKEWRFLHPLLPIMHVLAAVSMVDGSPRGISPSPSYMGRLNLKRIHIILPILTLPLSLYVIRYHGRAQIAVMDYLRSIPPEELHSVGFLMPCHSTPMQSHLHRPHLEKGRLWAIGCEPPLNMTSPSEYKDQSDVFFDSPTRYLQLFFPPEVDPSFLPSPLPSAPPGKPLRDDGSQWVWQHTWPSHLALFGTLSHEPEIKELLKKRGYEIVIKIGNGFEEDQRRRGGIYIWQWQVDT